MAIIKAPCDGCGNLVVSTSRLCPHCGSRSPNGSRNLLTALGAIAVVLFLVFSAIFGRSTADGSASLQSSSAPVVARQLAPTPPVAEAAPDSSGPTEQAALEEAGVPTAPAGSQDIGAPEAGVDKPGEAFASGAGADAAAFLGEYMRVSGGDTASALDWMARHYADRVRFFGRDLGRDEILQQKVAYVRRWPERSYVLDPASVRVRCDGPGDACVVAGIIDWTVRSEDRGARASGRSTIQIETLGGADDREITAERSVVVDRD